MNDEVLVVAADFIGTKSSFTQPYTFTLESSAKYNDAYLEKSRDWMVTYTDSTRIVCRLRFRVFRSS